MADRKGETCEANSFPQCKEIKCDADCDYAGIDHVKSMKTRISASRLSGEQVFESVTTDSKNGSALAFEDNSKCREFEMQSSDRIASTPPTSVKSEISTETHLPVVENGSFEMDVKKTHDSQHGTESSCSNSLPVMPPTSFSNQSYLETSKDAYLFRNCGSSMDSSNSKTFDRSPEEPVTASSESGVSAQIASTAMRNVKARTNMKVSSMAGNHSSSTIKKGDAEISHKWGHETATPENGVGEVLEQTDMYKWVLRNTSSTEEKNLGTVGKSSAFSDNSDNFICKRDNLPTSCPGERMIKNEISGEGENISTGKGKPLEMGPDVLDKIKGEFWVNESLYSSMTKPSKCAMKGQDKFIAGFDLNEDINSKETDDHIEPVVETTYSHNVIHVVAKAGILIGQPIIPLEFEGGLGWKGSAETSAFRPASASKDLDRKTRSTNHRPKDTQGFTGIDLNVAAVEDNDAVGVPVMHEGVFSPSTLKDSRSEVDSKQAKMLCIDLNCLYDASDEFTQPSRLAKSEISPLVDLNSNASVAKKSDNVHWLGQGCQSLGNKTSDSLNPGTRDFNITRRDYLADLSTLQHLANSGHTLMAAPQILQPVELIRKVDSLQPNLPLVSHTLPPHSYSSKGPFHFGYLSGTMPYTGYYREHSILPEVLYTPHLARVVPEQSTSNFTASIPKLDGKTEHNLSTSGSKMDEPRPFPFLARNSPMGEGMHQEAWYAASMKRKEPEGGLEYYQLGYKQVT